VRGHKFIHAPDVLYVRARLWSLVGVCSIPLSERAAGAWQKLFYFDSEMSKTDRNLLNGSGDRTIKIWSIGTWICEHTLEGHNGGVSSLIMHGDKLISFADDIRQHDQSMKYR
jgi:WD40 repeat protein